MGAQAAGAPDTDGLRRPDHPGLGDRGIGGGDRVGDDGGLVEGQVVGDGGEGVLPGDGVLGPAAVVVDATRERPWTGGAAHAVGARSARLAGLQGDAHAGGPVPQQVGPQRVDDARDLVAEGDRARTGDRLDRKGRGEASVDQMDVGQAHSGGPDLDQHLSGAGDGNGDLFDREGAGVQVEASGQHGGGHDANLGFLKRGWISGKGRGR